VTANDNQRHSGTSQLSFGQAEISGALGDTEYGTTLGMSVKENRMGFRDLIDAIPPELFGKERRIT
jgi:hypothetical protein